MDNRDEDSEKTEPTASVVDAVSRAPPEAMLVFDRFGTIHGMNGESERLFGFTGRDLIGKGIERVLTIAETGRLPEPNPSPPPQADRTGEPIGWAATIETIGRTRSGATFPAELVVMSPTASDRLTAIVKLRSDHEATGIPYFAPRNADTPTGDRQDSRRLLGRLLVCEPDPGIAARLQAIMEADGFIVDLAPDARHAHRLIEANGYAAITLDLMLPDQDGLALVRDLRSHPKTRDLPVIMVSAKSDHRHCPSREPHDLAGGAFGIVDWIQNPMDDRRFAETLRHAVGHPGPQRPRVLHVEDDRELIRIVASKVGSVAVVDAATTLGQARLRLASEPFDLVILDLRLPDGSGFELLDDIKKLVPPVPVLLVSATEATPHSGAALADALVKSRTTDRNLVNVIHSLAAATLPPLQRLPKSLELAAKC